MNTIIYTSSKDEIIDAAEEITDQLSAQVKQLKEERKALWITLAFIVSTSLIF